MSEGWIITWIIAGTIAGIAALVAALIGLDLWLSSVACEARWRDSAFESRWGVWTGCQIQLPDRTWIPSGSYREIPT